MVQDTTMNPKKTAFFPVDGSDEEVKGMGYKSIKILEEYI